ncbi:hypothetical protein, partial [Nocardia jejuensis]|uniref:hypothetical protein n=1 Tax=Nocardia jejuensis TaxID=328049 RepID=UPI001C3FE76C
MPTGPDATEPTPAPGTRSRVGGLVDSTSGRWWWTLHQPSASSFSGGPSGSAVAAATATATAATAAVASAT